MAAWVDAGMTVLDSRPWLLSLGIFATLSCRAVEPFPEESVELGRRLMVNEQATCALDQQGAVYCWGANGEYMEYGVGSSVVPPSDTPVAVPVPALRSFASGVGTHFCGIDRNDRAICWARGTFGQLGRGTLGEAGNAPAPVDGDLKWRELSVGRITTCGVSDDRKGYCWGTNQRGEMGIPSLATGVYTTSPKAVMGGDLRFRTIATGWRHACGITTADQTFCWGDNAVGQLGLGVADTMARRLPALVSGGLTFVQLALSAEHSCGIATDGFAYCWGNNEFGQLGDGTTTDRYAPTRVGDIRFTQIAAGSGFAGMSHTTPPTPRLLGGVAHTCALAESGAAYCWGWNGNGQLGDGTMVDRHSPVAVIGGQAFDQIGAAGSHTCGMRGNAIWCWGSNFTGQLGMGASGVETGPRQVTAPFNAP